MTTPARETKRETRGDKKFPIGSVVTFRDANGATSDVEVLKHGRDANGCYTQIRFNGEKVKVHRSMLGPRP